MLACRTARLQSRVEFLRDKGVRDEGLVRLVKAHPQVPRNRSHVYCLHVCSLNIEGTLCQ